VASARVRPDARRLQAVGLRSNKEATEGGKMELNGKDGVDTGANSVLQKLMEAERKKWREEIEEKTANGSDI